MTTVQLIRNDNSIRSRGRQRIPEKLPALGYLVLIGLLAAIAAGAFRMDDHALLWPAGIASVLILLFISTRKAMHFWKFF